MAEADHYSHMPTVKILRLGGERLPPPPPPKKKKKKKKIFDHSMKTGGSFYDTNGLVDRPIIEWTDCQKVKSCQDIVVRTVLG